MKSPEAIEAALARLMPTAISEGGQESLDALIDQLAADAPAVRGPVRQRYGWLAAAAAVTLAVGSGAYVFHGAKTPVQPTTAAAVVTPDSFENLACSEKIETVSDEGLVQDKGGNALRATRLRIIGTKRFRDATTGAVVEVTAPREEVVYDPVSSF